LVYSMLGRIFDTASTSLHIIGVVEHLRPVISLIDYFISEEAASRIDSHSHYYGFPASLSKLRLVRDTLDRGQHEA